MKMEITDAAALMRLSPIDVRHYLEANNWREIGRYGKSAVRFAKGATPEVTRQVLLPVSHALADFSDRMRDIISEIAEDECRTQLQVFHDLAASGADVFRLWAPEADERGTVALQMGALVCEQAISMLSAAAKAENKSAKTFRPANPKNVEEYLSTVRLGLTEAGSYVFPVISPVVPSLSEDDAQLVLFPGSERDPFSRRVMRKLDGALTAVRTAIDETIATDNIAPFELAVEAGVSANLCDALARLVQRVDTTRLSITWSAGRPAPGPSNAHYFRADDQKILDEVVRVFRRDEPVDDVRIFGMVVKSARSPDALDGRIWLQTNWENRLRVVLASLPHTDYEKSVDAHRRKLPILLDGDLYKDGRNLILQSARNLRVVEEEFGEQE